METVILSREINSESWDIETEEIVIPVSSLPEYLDSYKWYAAAAESDAWTPELIKEAFAADLKYPAQRHVTRLLEHPSTSAEVVLRYLHETFSKSADSVNAARRWDYLSVSFITAGRNPNLTAETLETILGDEFYYSGMNRRNLLIAFIDHKNIPKKFFDEAFEINDSLLFEYMVRNKNLPLDVMEKLADKADTVSEEVFAGLLVAQKSLPESFIDTFFRKVNEAHSKYPPELLFEALFEHKNLSAEVLIEIMRRTRSTLIAEKITRLRGLPEHVYWYFYNKYIAYGEHTKRPDEFPDMVKLYTSLAQNPDIPMLMVEFFARDSNWCELIIPTLRERTVEYDGLPEEWVKAALPLTDGESLTLKPIQLISSQG